MAPVVNQTSFALHNDALSLFSVEGIDFNEIEDMSITRTITFDDLFTTTSGYDNTKLTENLEIGLPGIDNTQVLLDIDATIEQQPAAPAAVEVQPATLTTLELPEVLGQDLPLSPEMVLLQPVSPGDVTVDQSDLIDSSCETLMSLISSQPAESLSVQAPYTVLAVDKAESHSPAVHLKNEVVVDMESSVSSVKEEPAVKRRGRKPKNPGGRAPRRQPYRVKAYEMGPLNDPKEEKKRKNAVNAKLHRDKQKQDMKVMAEQLKEVIAERDMLLKQVEQYKFNESQLKQRMMNMQRSRSGLQQ